MTFQPRMFPHLHPAAGRLLAAAVLLLAVTVPATAQDDDAGDDDATFNGAIRLGYRSVNVDGADRKYREDVDLEDGPRLFDLSFDFAPESPVVDRIRLDLANFGGDPFETLDLGIQRHDAFNFRYSRNRSEYFYQDVILPQALASVTASSGGDFHHFDFERVRDNAELDVDVGRRAGLVFGFDRYTKTGDASTTLDLQRDEFELERVIDESLNAWHAGFEVRWSTVTLTLEERMRDYDNAVEIFLPGASPGENTANAAQLDFYFLDQPYDTTTHEHVARIVARPTDRWILRGQASLQNLDLDVHAEESQGGTGFNGLPFTDTASGDSGIGRDSELFDFDVSYLLSDRVALTGSAYRRSFDQDGDFLFAGGRNLGRWEVTTDGLEAGVERVATPAWTLNGGVRWESREVERGFVEAGGPGDRATLDEGETTDHTGYFATASWRPAEMPLTVTAEVDSSSFDDPFTLASPTDRLRYRLKARYKLTGGFTLDGSYVGHDTENDNSGWDASYDQANVSLGYRHEAVDLSLGYGRVEIDRSVDQQVTFLPSTVLLRAVDYSASSDFIDGRVRWQATPTWALGGSLLLYDNSGSFGLQRDDYRAWVEYLFPQGYTGRLGYRSIDYSEDTFSFDDYSADILEASLSYRW